MHFDIKNDKVVPDKIGPTTVVDLPSGLEISGIEDNDAGSIVITFNGKEFITNNSNDITAVIDEDGRLTIVSNTLPMDIDYYNGNDFIKNFTGQVQLNFSHDQFRILSTDGDFEEIQDTPEYIKQKSIEGNPPVEPIKPQEPVNDSVSNSDDYHDYIVPPEQRPKMELPLPPLPDPLQEAHDNGYETPDESDLEGDDDWHDAKQYTIDRHVTRNGNVSYLHPDGERWIHHKSGKVIKYRSGREGGPLYKRYDDATDLKNMLNKHGQGDLYLDPKDIKRAHDAALDPNRGRYSEIKKFQDVPLPPTPDDPSAPKFIEDHYSGPKESVKGLDPGEQLEFDWGHVE